MSSSSMFDCCNHTELYQLCKRAGLEVHPGLSREQLAEALLSEAPDAFQPNPLDAWREGLLHFAREYWSKLQNVVTCPLKAPDGGFNEGACYGCIDTQVVACVVANKSNEEKMMPAVIHHQRLTQKRKEESR